MREKVKIASNRRRSLLRFTLFPSNAAAIKKINAISKP